MSTRILSAFSLLKRVGFAVLLLGGNAFAQPFDVLWDRSGQGPESGYGASLFSLGDQNDDGYMDWGVNSSGQIAGDPSESLSEFFYGGRPPQTTPYHVWRADSSLYIRYLFSEPLGDLNGDGYVDWQVNLWPRDSQVQRVEIHLGGPNATFLPSLTLELPLSQSRLDGMGDINSDGFDDMFVRDPDNLPHTRILFGGVELDSIADVVSDAFIRAFPFGDLNGDGFADFMDTDENVYMGSATPDLVPEYHWEGASPGRQWIVPDVNGDGKDELMTGEFGHRANVFLGADSLSSTPDAILNFDGCPDGFVYAGAGLGDINNDWHQDIAVLDIECINGWGGVAIYLGYRWINLNPIVTIIGRTQPYNLVGIFSAAGLGDVDGDGIGDFIIGAFSDDFDGERGRAVVFAGSDEYVVSSDDSPEIPERLEVSVYPNPFNNSATVALELPFSARSVTLTLFNTLGQEVRREELNFITSSMQYRLDGQGLSTGLYFLTVRAGNLVQTKKLVVLK